MGDYNNNYQQSGQGGQGGGYPQQGGGYPQQGGGYPQPNYQPNYQPGGPPQGGGGGGKGFAIPGMILSIVGLIWSFMGILGWVGLFFAIPGLILSIIGKSKNAGGMAMAGLIMSVLAIVIGIIMTIACAACATSYNFWY